MSDQRKLYGTSPAMAYDLPAVQALNAEAAAKLRKQDTWWRPVPNGRRGWMIRRIKNGVTIDNLTLNNATRNFRYYETASAECDRLNDEIGGAERAKLLATGLLP